MSRNTKLACLLISLSMIWLSTLVIADDAADETYQSGRSALEEGRFDDAAERFAQVIDSGGSNAAAAAYWRAYSLHKAGRSTPAMEILADFRNDYPNSPWSDDARALAVDIRGNSFDEWPEDDETDDVKMMALHGLLNVEASRALPILQKYLSDEQPKKYREMALFVLAQSQQPEARELLLQAARGQQGAANQGQAIQLLGMNGDADMVETLVSIYHSTTDREIKHSALHGLMMAEDTKAIISIMAKETDADLRSAAVQQLGILEATDQLLQLYRSETDVELREQVLHALFVAKAEDTLIDLAYNEPVPKLREAAIHGLALVGSESAADALVKIYRQSSDMKSREAVLHGLFLADQDERLIEIARSEKDPALQRLAVQALSRISSKLAENYMLEILEN